MGGKAPIFGIWTFFWLRINSCDSHLHITLNCQHSLRTQIAAPNSINSQTMLLSLSTRLSFNNCTFKTNLTGILQPKNRFMVFNVTFNNISVILCWSVLLVEETGVPGENHWPVASQWQTLSHNVVSGTPRH
jgi:hypothetical protein